MTNTPEREPEQAQDPKLHDRSPALETLRADVLAGLSASPRYVPSQYLYDDRGARLFERICEQPEYYVPRTEAAIVRDNMADIARAVGPRALLIEPGSGDGIKSRALLQGLHDPVGYVPIDISRAQLLALARDVAARFPGLEVTPVCADFTEGVELPGIGGAVGRRLAFFPGSTLGNFEPAAQLEVLRELRRLAGPGGLVLLGVDLRKDPAVIEPAYDDAAGVSAEFARNVLVRLNRELGADFDPTAFAYEAPYDVERGRVEMALVSRVDQVLHVDGRSIHFARGERIRTEYSHKFEIEALGALASRAGLEVGRVWTDARRWFAVLLLEAC